MPTLSQERIAALLEPYLPLESGIRVNLDEIFSKLSTYLDLLVRWNARTNLTAVRNPEEIVERHFGESIFAATILVSGTNSASSLLDFGSGAGFPGIPIQVCLPTLSVCLAESQGKKAAFLREAVRVLKLETEVWARRVEDMPLERTFSIVTLRAVDSMNDAVSAAAHRVERGGYLAELAGDSIHVPQGWNITQSLAIPDSKRRFLHLLRRSS